MTTNNSLIHKRRLVFLWMACLFAAMLAPCAVLFAQSKSQTTAKEVPEVLLKRMRAQYVPDGDQTQGLTETMKLRRYKAILSEGSFAERRYAGAANLHELRHLMLLAAKGKAALEGTPESGRQLMAIAERLAESPAPPDKRLPADLLLVRAKLDELGNAPAEVSDELDVLVARYTDTPVAAEVLKGAVGLAETGGARASARRFLERLANDHIAEPGVREFLTSEGEDKPAYFSRLFTTRLTLLDGQELVIPRDTLGKPTLLHFWTIERPGLLAKPGPILLFTPEGVPEPQSMIRFADIAKDYPSLNIIGINLDTDRTAVQRFIDEQELSWPVAFSGLGWNDPFLKTYTVNETPTYWLIAPDGRSYQRGVSAARVPKGFSVWGSYNQVVRRQLDMLGGVEARVPYYRSGVFLLDMPDLLPPGRLTSEAAPLITGAIPTAELEAVVVSVNLDDSRAEVEKFLGEHPEFNNWIHVFSGQGWHDSLARELDVYSLPRAVLINREGLIERWATGGQFDTEMLHSLATDGRRSGREWRSPAPPQATDGIETQQQWADLPRNLSLELGEGNLIELVLVGPGEFAKGSTPEEIERYEDEWPRRQVRLTEPWYMGVHPVTRGQFASFIEQSGYTTEAEREGHALIWTDKGWQRTPGASWANPGFEQDDSHPVVCVSFNDANKFCQWLGKKTGRDVRLPTMPMTTSTWSRSSGLMSDNCSGTTASITLIWCSPSTAFTQTSAVSYRISFAPHSNSKARNGSTRSIIASTATLRRPVNASWTPPTSPLRPNSVSAKPSPPSIPFASGQPLNANLKSSLISTRETHDESTIIRARVFNSSRPTASFR